MTKRRDIYAIIPDESMSILVARAQFKHASSTITK
jgi:hypothetical protein